MPTSKSLQFSSGDPLTLTEDHIQSVLSVRRARARIFGENLFSDPAWDMILELYAANLSGTSLSLRELAVTTGTPVSTTARWASILEEIGLVETTKTAIGAGAALKLTHAGAAKMEQLAGQWASAFISI